MRLYAASAAVAAEVAQLAEAQVRRLEHKYSRYRADSVLSALNRQAGQAQGALVDEETAALLDYAAAAWEHSDGLFDITSGVLRRVWNFDANRVPTACELAAVLPRVGWSRLRWERPHLRFGVPGMELDFGGVAKEYAADCAAGVCRRAGITSGLVELGGDIALIGPHPDGSPWLIGIRHPRQPETAVASIPLWQGGLATSGDYERFMLVEGRRYCHLLLPHSGYPVVSALAGVSVVADSCLVAGTAATVGMLKGPQAQAWLDALGVTALLVDAEGQPFRAA